MSGEGQGRQVGRRAARRRRRGPRLGLRSAERWAPRSRTVAMRRAPTTRSVSSLTTHSIPATWPSSSCERAVGEGVVGLLAVAAALEEQQQRLVPGRLAGGHHRLDAGADVGPDLRPDLATRAGRAPTGTCCRGCRAGRRRCTGTSAPGPRPSTWRTATTAAPGPCWTGWSASRPGRRAASRPSRRPPGPRRAGRPRGTGRRRPQGARVRGPRLGAASRRGEWPGRPTEATILAQGRPGRARRAWSPASRPARRERRRRHDPAADSRWAVARTDAVSAAGSGAGARREWRAGSRRA